MCLGTISDLKYISGVLLFITMSPHPLTLTHDCYMIAEPTSVMHEYKFIYLKKYIIRYSIVMLKWIILASGWIDALWDNITELDK